MSEYSERLDESAGFTGAELGTATPLPDDAPQIAETDAQDGDEELDGDVEANDTDDE